MSMKVSTPELLWHGGANEAGKPDPVYSVDLHPTENVLSTSGIDDSIPPKGSVRLWKINPNVEGQEFLIDLCDHQSTVNIARFSPCGKMLASASEKQIVVYVGEWHIISIFLTDCDDSVGRIQVVYIDRHALFGADLAAPKSE